MRDTIIVTIGSILFTLFLWFLHERRGPPPYVTCPQVWRADCEATFGHQYK